MLQPHLPPPQIGLAWWPIEKFPFCAFVRVLAALALAYPSSETLLPLLEILHPLLEPWSTSDGFSWVPSCQYSLMFSFSISASSANFQAELGRTHASPSVRLSIHDQSLVATCKEGLCIIDSTRVYAFPFVDNRWRWPADTHSTAVIHSLDPPWVSVGIRRLCRTTIFARLL